MAAREAATLSLLRELEAEEAQRAKVGQRWGAGGRRHCLLGAAWSLARACDVC